MKKLISVLLAAAMTVSAMSVSAFAEIINTSDYNEPVYALGSDLSLYDNGDVTLDGVIDSKDANLIIEDFCMYELLELGHRLNEDQLAFADVWKDERNRIDSKDAIVVIYYWNCQLLEMDGTVGIGMDEFVNLYTETSGFKEVLEP